MASIALNIARPVFQGALGALAAQAGFYLYIRSSKTPEQKLSAWAFTLIAGCAAGAALGVSASALLIGVAVHTLLLLKDQEKFFNRELVTGEGKIRTDNFPYPLGIITEDAPTGALRINHFSLDIAGGWYSSERPCLCAYIEICRERKIIDFRLNTNKTLSLPGDNFEFPLYFDERTGEAMIDLSDDKDVQLTLTHLTSDPTNLRTTMARHIPKANPQYEQGIYQQQPDCLICGNTIRINGYNASEWKKVDELPPVQAQESQSQNYYGRQVCSTDYVFGRVGEEATGRVFFRVDDEIIAVSYYKIFGKLYLRNAWGNWKSLGKLKPTATLELDALTAKNLGLTVLARLNKSEEVDSQSQQRKARDITLHRGSLDLWMPETNDQDSPIVAASLKESKTPLVYIAAFGQGLEGEQSQEKVSIFEDSQGALTVGSQYADLVKLFQKDWRSQREHYQNSSWSLDS